MPPYAFLADAKVDFGGTSDKLAVMHTLGVPYDDIQIAAAASDARRQADAIAVELKQVGVDVAPDSEMIALIAYLQALGTKAPLPDDTPTHVIAGGQP